MLARRLAVEAPALCAMGLRGLATKQVAEKAALSGKELAELEKESPTTIAGGQAFPNDLRSISGLSMYDGIYTHTEKWLQGNHKSPMQYIQESEPIKVHGLVVASYGSDDPALGCPVEYINLKGTTRDNPAVCKYTGNKYYSDDWMGGGAH